jgi:hypothetical protein
MAKVGPTGQMLQRNPMQPFVDQRLEVRRCCVIDPIEQRQSGELHSCGVRQKLPRILLWRLDTSDAELACRLDQQGPDGPGHGVEPAN